VHWLDFNKRILLLEMHGTNIKIKKKFRLLVSTQYAPPQTVHSIILAVQRIHLQKRAKCLDNLFFTAVKLTLCGESHILQKRSNILHYKTPYRIQYVVAVTLH
jgi:hypothetical protein